jgi:hypothetical protein
MGDPAPKTRWLGLLNYSMVPARGDKEFPKFTLGLFELPPFNVYRNDW